MTTVGQFLNTMAMNLLWREEGQFLPITAMVMLTIVVMMVAVVNVYTVTRAKLKVQNIAEAAALNLAAKEAQAYNVVVDRNEWLNHMMVGLPTVNPDKDVIKQLGSNNAVANCDEFFKKFPSAQGNRPFLLPPISCVENKAPADTYDTAPAEKRFVFGTGVKDKNGIPGGLKNYADLVKTINDAQRQFVQAYNSFLGDASARQAQANSSLAGSTDFRGQLEADIPDLNDPNLACTAWNTKSNEEAAMDYMKNFKQNPGQISGGGNGPGINPMMQPLSFKVDHDIDVRYHMATHVDSLFGSPDLPYTSIGPRTTLGAAAGVKDSEGVGWMVPNTEKEPKIDVQNDAGPKSRVGVSLYCVEKVDLPGGQPYAVTAKAKAFLVDQSGSPGAGCAQGTGTDARPCEPKGGFRPTYWVKLAPEPQESNQ